jgi:molybdate transport system regulatory protein
LLFNYDSLTGLRLSALNNCTIFMAGHAGSRYYDIFLNQQVQLVTRENEKVIDEEGFTLLTEIRKEQSIVAASRNMGISYRKAWGLLRKIESVLGFELVGKHRGGKMGGKTELTSDGMKLTEAYMKLKADLDTSIHDSVKAFFATLNNLSDRK